MKNRWWAWLPVLILLMACGVHAQVIRGGMPPADRPTRPPRVDYKGPAGSDIPNLGIIKKQIIAYRESGKWDEDILAVTDQAHQYLDARVKAVQKPAMVLDIDETSLSNWEYFDNDDFSFLGPTLVKWIGEARDPQILGTGNLYRYARSQSVAVFFISGRKESLRAPTEKNLENAGYAGYAGLYLEPENYNEKSVVPYKSGARKEIESRGYTILVNVGDQESDLAGGASEKTYKLPNPMYFIP